MLQVVLSYFAMLAAMTYAVEIFLATCLGLAVGFAAFNIEDGHHDDSAALISAEPCCGSVDDAALSTSTSGDEFVDSSTHNASTTIHASRYQSTQAYSPLLTNDVNLNNLPSHDSQL